MENDTSILFEEIAEEKFELDYTISLGADPRVIMDLSCETGRCGPLRCFLGGVKIVEKALVLPESKTGELYFVDDEKMTKYSGSMYLPFEDSCYYDETKNILCFGNPDLQGIAIEFVSNTYAVIYEGKITSVFMIVSSLKDKIVVRKGCFERIKI